MEWEKRMLYFWARGESVSQVSNQKYVEVPLFVRTKEMERRLCIWFLTIFHKKEGKKGRWRSLVSIARGTS